ncbi:MAG: hypothetical protein AAB664_02850 [Patescibacteria group bacterium]
MCTITPITNTDKISFSCMIELAYFADATTSSSYDWTALVRVSDTDGLFATATSTIDVVEILAADMGSSIDFGSLSAGESTNTDTNVAFLIKQTGNSITDLQVAGTNMTCTSGTIPRSNLSYLLTDSAGGIPLTSKLKMFSAFNLPLRISETVEQTKNLYWNITIPLTVSGTCNGSVTVTATSNF